MKALATLCLLSVLAGCSGGASQKAATSTPLALPSRWLMNGKAIFVTGRDANGVRMTAATRPLRPACASCHRQDGSGGVHLPGGALSADLRHKALVTNQKHPYTLALLERAISSGVDNEGKRLDPVMPRWRMPRNDLHDVAQYVFRQLK